MFFFLFIILIASVYSIDTNDQTFTVNDLIVGGERAVIETFPYQVSIESRGLHECGGSIISSRYIITAGHCTDELPSKYTIRAGTSLRNKGGSIHRVVNIIRHENYFTDENETPHNDIALMRVDKPFRFDNSRQTINLFEAGEAAEPGTNAIITGWGDTGKGLTKQLQTASVPIMSKALCNNAYKNFGGISKGQICAAYYGEGGKDACQGDSGGPLTIDGRLAGIVSWGNGCAEPKYPGVYTEIAAYRNWIDGHVELSG